MKNLTNKFVSLTFIAVFILILVVSSEAQANKYNFREHRAEIIEYVKKYSASNLENSLPKSSFSAWVQRIVGAKTKVEWALVECAVPDIGLESEITTDLPMCVEALVRVKPKVFIRIDIEFGTIERGIGKSIPTFNNVFVTDKIGNVISSVDDLAELPKLLRATRNSQPYFNPNRGEFEISGKKPRGFKDFSSIWFQTIECDSNNKSFPLLHGDVEAGGKHFDLQNIFFDGIRWSFKTQIVGGVSYEFSGKFAKNIEPRYGAGDADNKAVYGRLIKFVRGKKAAEAKVFFNFYETGDAG